VASADPATLIAIRGGLHAIVPVGTLSTAGASGTQKRKTTRGHKAETTNAIVNSPIAVSNTLWHQRAITVSISNLL
jgi:hypothetical protein